jgi:hypothetical protein
MHALIRSIAYFNTCLLFVPAWAADKTEDPDLKARLERFKSLESNLSLPLAERVQAVPEDYMKFLIDFDKSIGIKNTDYKTRVPTAEDKALVTEYVKLLPDRYQKTFNDKLMVVYFIDNFAGAGLTDWVIDEKGKFHYYMILNSALLTQSLDAWLTYRENAFFTGDTKPSSIRVRTATPYKALLYGLLHEGGHIVDVEYHITPYVEEAHKKFIKQKKDVTNFTRDVWQERKKPEATYDFKNRDKLNAYGIFNRALIPAAEMADMFLQLTDTPFVSFYAGSAWQEDFADLLTYHYIDDKLGGTVVVELLDGTKVARRYLPAKRMQTAKRKKILEGFIGGDIKPKNRKDKGASRS